MITGKVITLEMGPGYQKAKNTIGPDLKSFLGISLSTLNSNIDHQFPGQVQGGISVLKAVDRYLRKFRLKSGANQVDLGKAAETAVDLYEHCTLVLFNGTK